MSGLNNHKTVPTGWQVTGYILAGVTAGLGILACVAGLAFSIARVIAEAPY